MSEQIVLRACTDADWPDFIHAGSTAFGNTMPPEHDAGWRKIVDPQNLLAATETVDGDETIVGSAGWLPFEMTVPGGELRIAAVTMVTVRPTHRRRGILRRMMRHQLEQFHASGVAAALLWASESSIYPRFGYGLAHVKGRIEIEPRRAQFVGGPKSVGRTRLVSQEQALELMPPIYERARREIPGAFARSADWWDFRKLSDEPAMRGDGGPLHRVIWERDGQPEGYALYRYFISWDANSLPVSAVEVIEALGTSPVATGEVWRYLLSLDLVARVRTHRLYADHSLQYMLEDPRQLRMSVGDGTWIRLVDMAAALSKRSYLTEGSLTFELADADCPWNAGVWTLTAGADGASVQRAKASPGSRLSATELASLYLGTVRCTSLLRAGRVEEIVPGAASRADVLLRSDVAPWCLDDF